MIGPRAQSRVHLQKITPLTHPISAQRRIVYDIDAVQAANQPAELTEVYFVADMVDRLSGRPLAEYKGQGVVDRRVFRQITIDGPVRNSLKNVRNGSRLF
jgi:hypothetical protein